MKGFKRFIRLMGIILILLFIFKEPIYHILFTYQSIGTRSLLDFSPPAGPIPEVTTQSEAIYTALEFTIKQLKFSTDHIQQEPNAVMESKKANCIGYAALFTAYYNWIAEENQLSSRAKQHIGRIYLFKYNLHHFFNNSFFADHDFVIITDTKTQKNKAVDPTVKDYLGIDRVSIR